MDEYRIFRIKPKKNIVIKYLQSNIYAKTVTLLMFLIMFIYITNKF